MNRQVFLQTMIALASAAFGLVAALAWNAAIQATIARIMGPDDSLTGLYVYAILAVIVLVSLGRAAARVGGEAAITK